LSTSKGRTWFSKNSSCPAFWGFELSVASKEAPQRLANRERARTFKITERDESVVIHFKGFLLIQGLGTKRHLGSSHATDRFLQIGWYL
jgi:hypothetical protein